MPFTNGRWLLAFISSLVLEAACSDGERAASDWATGGVSGAALDPSGGAAGADTRTEGAAMGGVPGGSSTGGTSATMGVLDAAPDSSGDTGTPDAERNELTPVVLADDGGWCTTPTRVLLWLRGQYRTYTDYQQEVVALIGAGTSILGDERGGD